MRAKNFIDLAGRRFGRLTAVSVQAVEPTRWLCKCDCGADTVKRYQHLIGGLSRSCGCLRREVATTNMRAMSTTHGLSGEAGFVVWTGMMRRCYNEESPRFHRYGGRGIGVCARWHAFENFLADMGPPPLGLTLERVNNDDGYSPENCRWASYVEQNNNRATTRLIAHDGEALSAAEWARRVGVSKATMYWRLKHWPIERALA